MNEIQNSWYNSLVDDCKAIIVEHEFTSRWALVEGYHELGKRIYEDNANFERSKIYGGEIVARLRDSLGKSESTIWRAVQFYKKYPNLEALPEGKNTSWHAVCQKYLPTPKMSTEEAQEAGLVSKADFSSVDKIVKMGADLCTLLDNLNESNIDPDSMDYMVSQLRLTMGKVGRFVLNHEKR